jgi:hypothetical protein
MSDVFVGLLLITRKSMFQTNFIIWIYSVQQKNLTVFNIMGLKNRQDFLPHPVYAIIATLQNMYFYYSTNSYLFFKCWFLANVMLKIQSL